MTLNMPSQTNNHSTSRTPRSLSSENSADAQSTISVHVPKSIGHGRRGRRRRPDVFANALFDLALVEEISSEANASRGVDGPDAVTREGSDDERVDGGGAFFLELVD